MTKCSILLPSNFDQENDFKKFKKIDTETYNTYIAILNRLWQNSILIKFGEIKYLTMRKKLK